MTAYLIVAASLFAVASSSAVCGTVLMLTMLAEINRTRPADKQLPSFGFTARRSIEMWREYRRSCPGGRLHTYLAVVTALVFVGAIGAWVCFNVAASHAHGQ